MSTYDNNLKRTSVWSELYPHMSTYDNRLKRTSVWSELYPHMSTYDKSETYVSVVWAISTHVNLRQQSETYVSLVWAISTHVNLRQQTEIMSNSSTNEYELLLTRPQQCVKRRTTIYQNYSHDLVRTWTVTYKNRATYFT